MQFPSRRQFIASAAVAPLAGCVGIPLVPKSKGDPSAVAEANNSFGCDLYVKLSTAEGNVFFSPFSIEAALAMTCAGARGNTLAQMQQVLHLPADADKIHTGFQSLFADLNGDSISARKRGCEFSVANALWGMKSETWRKEFLMAASKHYGSGLIEVDFTKPDSAAKTINTWVERKTHERIKDLVSPQIFTALTRLVLTNAIYFKGSWDTAFLKERTEVEPFHRLDGTKRDVPLMHRINDFAYTENDAFQAIDLPYKGKDLSMLVWLPRRTDAFAEFEKKLTGPMIAETANSLRLNNIAVALALPKFTIKTAYSLEAPLAALGMKDAFNVGADFRGMTTGHEPFKIDAVLHKAFVEVNEEGTEAAAATAVAGHTFAAAPPRQSVNKVFRADRPFLFAIRHMPSNTVLFLGRVTDVG